MLRFRFLISVFLILLTSCAQAESDQTTVLSEQADFKIVSVAKDLAHPWSVAFLSNGEYLVTERRGKLWRIDKDGQKQEITGMPKVYNGGQGGLMDIALAPDFANSQKVYFSYAAMNDQDKGNTEVAYGTLDLNQNTINNIKVIFQALPKVEGSNHWGSRLLFAPDGMLHITLGERFDYEDQAQNPKNHLGTTIRITPEGSVPKDNPFFGHKENAPEIFTYGNRNAQGMAIHPVTKQIWINEHGPRGGDEINILKSGANYGWPAVTFGISYLGLEISDKTTAPGMEDPILQWTPSIAPSGMAFYTGDKFPNWKGDLFVGALAHTHLRRMELDGDKVTAQEELLKDRKERIRDVRQGPDGYIYLLTDDSNGQLLRLEPL